MNSSDFVTAVLSSVKYPAEAIIDIAGSHKTFCCCWHDLGEASDIMRGTWFLDGTWQPLETLYSEKIEEHHLQKFYKQTVQINAVKGKKPGENILVITVFRHRATFPSSFFAHLDIIKIVSTEAVW